MSANGQYQDDDNAEDEYDDVDSPAPIDPEEPIDFSLVYALHTFVANLEGQVCVLKGDSLELLDDSNSYWWLVKCIKTDEIGYIPAENVETPFERLARLNKMRNVHVASVQSQDLEAINVQKKGVPRNVVFPDTFVEYIENSDTEDSDEYDDELLRSNRSSNSLQRPKLNAGSLSRNFLSKLLGRGKKVKASSGTATAGGVAGTTRAVSDNVNTATADAGKSDKEPLNVLRIYAGNTDLKATFKTVALTKQMAATDLLSAALKRFRIPAQNIHEYYLSLLHMDSQEKRLSETDNIYNTLEELRHKSLPGLTTNSPLLVSSFINPKGGISRVRMTDDNIIKVIINKKLNLFEKDFHLIRIFMYDESDDTGRLRTYKTIGVGSEARVEEIVEVAKKKFQLPKDRRWEYTLHSIFRGEGERFFYLSSII
ncbi:hypothetical protein BC832DRAFT_250451 [Gaertneriomyces semiglobifer]|nr:hypothetical protein BC832DRAFT_250451 [Gaertneriomyces semiglobifer]